MDLSRRDVMRILYWPVGHQLASYFTGIQSSFRSCCLAIVNMRVSKMGGTPKFIVCKWKILFKWMITRGSPSHQESSNWQWLMALTVNLSGLFNDYELFSLRWQNPYELFSLVWHIHRKAALDEVCKFLLCALPALCVNLEVPFGGS